MDPTNCTVCVMDGAGQFGSRLVEKLVRRGYTVHATVQQHEGEDMLLSMMSRRLCFDDIKKVKIFHSDPFDYKSIMDALRGCSALFYTFEVPYDQPDYDEYMTDVEVRAAHNVLEACAQTDTIVKVVFTSSATATLWSNNDLTKSSSSSVTDLDERNWSDTTFCQKFKLWHALSKTLAEKSAWALAMDRGVNMVSINAGLVITPDLSISNPYLKGAAEMYEDGVFVTVDMNFLVDAHICVLEDISSYGRYLCFNHVINRQEDASKLAQMLVRGEAYATPSDQGYEEDTSVIKQQRISNKKLNKLMVDFIFDSAQI